MGRHARSGSHRAGGGPTRGVGTLLVLVLVAVALIVGLVTAFRAVQDRQPAPAAATGCGDTGLELAAVAEIAEVVRSALADDCDTVQVTAAAPGEVAARIEEDDAPDLWIPDSSRWSREYDATPLVDALATSPVVFAAAGQPPAGWAEALTTEGLVLGDPLTSTPPAVPLLAAAGELDEAGMVSVAQAQLGAESIDLSATERLDRLAEQDGGVTAVSEQQALAAGTDATLAVPEAGTVVLDYPLLRTATGDRADEIASDAGTVADLLGDGAVVDALAEAGFRDTDAAPVDGGVGAVTELEVPAEADTLLDRWGIVAVPTRGLAVIDVSGSMEFDAGPTTRMGLTIEAARAALTLFPGASELGLWIFSERLSGDQDHRELLPIRALGHQAGGATHHDRLAAELDDLAGRATGGTGLYETALAAFEAVQQNYDQDASNTVLLLTDGENDDPGSPSLSETVAELERLADPERPVRIIAIGISEEADGDALEALAAATGGSAYVARNPGDMASVFVDALATRG